MLAVPWAVPLFTPPFVLSALPWKVFDISPPSSWQSFFLPFCVPGSHRPTVLSWFLWRIWKSLSGCHLPSFLPSLLSILDLSFLPGWKDFSRAVRARLLQTPGDVDFVSQHPPLPWERSALGRDLPWGHSSPGMLSGAGAGTERGEGAVVLRLSRGFFTFLSH